MKLFIKEDINSYIDVSVYYYDNNDFNSTQHKDINKSGYKKLSTIKNMCSNSNDINFNNVNNITVIRYNNNYYITSVSGCDYIRGMFTDLYHIDKYISMNEKIDRKPTTEKLIIKENVPLAPFVYKRPFLSVNSTSLLKFSFIILAYSFFKNSSLVQ